MVKAGNISRHHVLLVFLLLIIIILGVGTYVLQRNAAINSLAGEAFRQRVSPPVSDLNLNVPNSNPNDSDIITKTCPNELTSVKQDWDLPGWQLIPWLVVDVQCRQEGIYCAYADRIAPHSDANYHWKDFQPDHLTFAQPQPLEGKNCIVSPNIAYTCQCQKGKAPYIG